MSPTWAAARPRPVATSHTPAAPPAPADATNLPSGDIDSDATLMFPRPLWASIATRGKPAPTSQILMSPSAVPTTTVLPSGVSATAYMLPFGSGRVVTSSPPAARFQTRVSPPLQVARNLPSGVIVRDRTPLCARVPTTFRVAVSHNVTPFPLTPPKYNVFPSGENAAPIQRDFVFKAPTSSSVLTSHTRTMPSSPEAATNCPVGASA